MLPQGAWQYRTRAGDLLEVEVLDQLESEGTPLSQACDTMRGRTGWYDPVIQEVLAKVRGAQESSEVRELPMTSLRPGMIFAQDVRNRKGTCSWHGARK